MKKVIIGLTLLVMVFAVSACGDSSECKDVCSALDECEYLDIVADYSDYIPDTESACDAACTLASNYWDYNEYTQDVRDCALEFKGNCVPLAECIDNL